MMDLLQEQERLELDMVRRGKERFAEIRRNAVEKGDALRSKPYRVVLDAALVPLSEAIRKFIEEATAKGRGVRSRASLFMRRLDPEALSYIALASLLASTGRNRVAVVAAAEKVGRAVEIEDFLQALQDEDPDLRGVIVSVLQDRATTTRHRVSVAKFLTGEKERQGVRDSWSNQDRVSVGLKLIELLIQSTGLFEIRRDRNGKRQTALLAPTARMKDWIEDLDLKIAGLFPTYIPTVVPPRDWTGLYSGGYLTDALPNPPTLVKTSNRAHIRLLEQADLSLVMKGLNALQRTPWQINVEVLQVAEELIRAGRPVAGLPDMDPAPIPTAPVDFNADPEVTKAWKRRAAAVYEANAKAGSKRIQALGAVSMSRDFARYGRIYFPWQCDFRGRAYPIPTLLSPQGSDLHKGLLRFADGAALGDDAGARCFEIHGANCWGKDKTSFPERQEWVSLNAAHILRAAQEPLDYTWWMAAKSPFQFLAWCFEYAAWQAEGFDLSFISRVPFAQDGTCNGIQHYSAMLRDPRGGAATNLVPSDAPQDIYAEVAEVVRARLRDFEGPEGLRFAQAWLDYGVDRELCKGPVMVLPYGGTRNACYSSIMAVVAEQPPGRLCLPVEDRASACQFLTKILWTAIGEVVVGATEAMKWLRDIAGQISSKGDALEWTAPSGFPVRQAYMASNLRQIEVTLFGKRFCPALQEATQEIDNVRQMNSLPPNFIHSMDAAAMILTACAAEDAGITQLSMIHDSYGCPAGQGPALAKILREKFVRIYTEPVLERLRDQLGVDASSQSYDPPFVGGLDLKEVLRSDYFFA